MDYSSYDLLGMTPQELEFLKVSLRHDLESTRLAQAHADYTIPSLQKLEETMRRIDFLLRAHKTLGE